jgi:hypothetical protein
MSGRLPSPRFCEHSVLSSREVGFLGLPSLVLGVVPLVVPGWVARLVGVRDDARTRAALRVLGARELVVAVVFLRRRTSPWLWAFVGQDALDLPVCTAILLGRRAGDPRRFGVAYAAYLAMSAIDVYSATSRNAASRNASTRDAGPRLQLSSLQGGRPP